MPVKARVEVQPVGVEAPGNGECGSRGGSRQSSSGGAPFLGGIFVSVEGGGHIFRATEGVSLPW